MNVATGFFYTRFNPLQQRLPACRASFHVELVGGAAGCSGPRRTAQDIDGCGLDGVVVGHDFPPF